MRVGHLDRIGDRPLGLFFERLGPAIPELERAEDAVVRGRRIAAAKLPADAHAELRVLGVAGVGTWQLAQLIVPSFESRGSKNNCRPSSIFARVSGLASRPVICAAPAARPSGSTGVITTWFFGSSSQAWISFSLSGPEPGMPAVSSGVPS